MSKYILKPVDYIEERGNYRIFIYDANNAKHVDVQNLLTGEEDIDVVVDNEGFGCESEPYYQALIEVAMLKYI